jgi:3-isopropylmalate/(R)-2-methylmalate dehydratase small subunit
MALPKITAVTGRAVNVPGNDIDTDRIIPARFMKCVTFDGLGEFLFHDVRNDPKTGATTNHPLNDPRFRGATILLSGANFGCGSSRENAVWALRNSGFRCIIALGFSDIFHENCFKNGVLPIVAEPREHAALMQSARHDAPFAVTVDVEACTLALPGGATIRFVLDERKRGLLMSGTDEIAATLAQADAIGAFRERDRRDRPWIYASRAEGGSA